MYLDVVDLRSFYAQPLGVVTRRLVSRAVRARFNNVHGLSVLGMLAAAFGYLVPVEGALLQEVIDVAVILNALRALRIRPREILVEAT